MSSDAALIDAAAEARDHAYAPYSKFRVGAALALRDGSVVTGVNVENCSYGLTVCAERNAVAAAVRAGAAPGDVLTIAIAADADATTPPCGACRQVLAEFVAPEGRLILHNVRDGTNETLRFFDLLPRAFLPSSFRTP